MFWLLPAGREVVRVALGVSRWMHILFQRHLSKGAEFGPTCVKNLVLYLFHLDLFQ